MHTTIQFLIIFFPTVLGAWALKLNTSGESFGFEQSEFPQVTVSGNDENLGENAYIRINNHTIDIFRKNPSLNLLCVATFPIEWVFYPVII